MTTKLHADIEKTHYKGLQEVFTKTVLQKGLASIYSGFHYRTARNIAVLPVLNASQLMLNNLKT